MAGLNTLYFGGRMDLMPKDFRNQFSRFQQLIIASDKGNPFTNFREGIAGAWEVYKPLLRSRALQILGSEKWERGWVGSGQILNHVIAAIEIQESRVITNNFVLWQNRFGHANRDHRIFLEAVLDVRLRRELEATLFALYRGDVSEEGATFETLRRLTDGKYPLLAYLFFLKDIERFAPIQPTTFDRVFRELQIDVVTLRNCSWENYQSYNIALLNVRTELAGMPGLSDVRLIDAHSFCWLLGRLEKETNGAGVAGSKDAGRFLSGRQKAIVAMRISILHTVKYANGQLVERTLKNKDTDLNPLQLDELLGSLMEIQKNRCALTGIQFDFPDPNADKALLPSPDRIDSDGHYVSGNLQVVCRFINMWKGTTENEEFKRLLMLVRNVGEEDAQEANVTAI
jgi:hypothetical protein